MTLATTRKVRRGACAGEEGREREPRLGGPAAPAHYTRHSVSGSVSLGPSSHSVRLPLSQGVLLLGGFASRVYTG